MVEWREQKRIFLILLEKSLVLNIYNSVSQIEITISQQHDWWFKINNNDIKCAKSYTRQKQ